MSYIESRLESGEKVVFQTHRTGGDIILGLLTILLEILFAAVFIFLTAFFPRIFSIGSEYRIITMFFLTLFPLLTLMTLWAAFIQLLNFFMPELALTDRRILGRVLKGSDLLFQKVDLPLSQIEKITPEGPFFKSRRVKISMLGKRRKLTLSSMPLSVKDLLAQYNAPKQAPPAG